MSNAKRRATNQLQLTQDLLAQLQRYVFELQLAYFGDLDPDDYEDLELELDHVGAGIIAALPGPDYPTTPKYKRSKLPRKASPPKSPPIPGQWPMP